MAICRTCYRRGCTKHPQTETPPQGAPLKDRWWFVSKIETVEQADRAIRGVSGTMYALAGAFLLVVLFLSKPEYLIDVFFLVAMGFALRRSRSRGVALLVAAYAMFAGVHTLLVHLGWYSGRGANVFLAALVIVAAFRGVYATFVYHREQRTRANIKAVVLLSAISIVLSAIAYVVVIVVTLSAGYDLEQEADSTAVGAWLIVGMLLPWFLVFGRVLPFIRRLRVVTTGQPTGQPKEHYGTVDPRRPTEVTSKPHRGWLRFAPAAGRVRGALQRFHTDREVPLPLPRFQPEASAQIPADGSPDAPSADGLRRRHFCCPLKKLEVEVEFATRSFLGLPRTVGVRQCTAFDQSRDVACGRHCLDSRFRRQWPAALPIMDRRRALDV